MDVQDHVPGDRATEPGEYEELNLFGTPTGKIAVVQSGDQFPAAPRGFVWRPLAGRPAVELRARATEYRRMAESAATAPVAISLRKLAQRLDVLADRSRQAECKQAEPRQADPPGP